MAKRFQNDDDMDLEAIKSQMSALNRRMDEVLTILVGNSSYGVKGMRSDVSDLKTSLINIKTEVENIQRDAKEKQRNEGFLNIKLETIPQKVAGVVAFLAVLISIIQGFKSLFTEQ